MTVTAIPAIRRVHPQVFLPTDAGRLGPADPEQAGNLDKDGVQYAMPIYTAGKCAVLFAGVWKQECGSSDSEKL
jgi:hypothetical protein